METALPVIAGATGNPVFFSETGQFTGTISGVGADRQPQDARQ
jgi:hypothetical protein